MKNQVNKKYFLPLLEDFYKKTKPFFECGYSQGPFVPYTMPKYGDAPVKIFYIGRDTYGWGKYDLFKKSREKYLNETVNYVNVEKMLEWKNKAGAFFPMICKLHLQIRTCEYIKDITSIDKKEKEILNEIGWGNLCSIEIPSTLEKKGEWDDIIDVGKYKEICNAAKPFETLKSLIEAYEPDFVFILSWLDKEEEFFKGLCYESKDELYEEGFRAVYTLKDYKTKVVWTLHPNRFSLKKTNQEEMCNYLTETFRNL